ncbi:MAG: DUF3991 and toprim domain-containing protein [Clostridiales bacterium]|jgi:hypothetical protein|nr:DUF3991 and toprim domain-containing protein [Clostridiales bacterium]
MLDKNMIEQARSTDIIAFFERRYGFSFVNRGSSFRCSQHPSLAIDSDRRSWYWHSKGMGGFGVLDYLIKAENMPFRDAVQAVTGIAPAAVPAHKKEKPDKTLILPEKNAIPLRLFDYLCNKRVIDNKIVNALIQEEKLYEDKHGNVVFIGFDSYKTPRFASLRGTNGDCRFHKDCPGSDKRYGFNMTASVPSVRLYIFESPIDAMSHASIENAVTGDAEAWKRHNRLSLAGTSDAAIPFFLNQHKTGMELILCMDNDPAGREASAVIARKYAEKGLLTRIEYPVCKDFNEDLQARVLRDKGARSPERTAYEK